VLDDGSYDALIVDAEARDGGVALELAIVAGPLKGEVVTLVASGLERDPVDLLGLPTTIVVTDGRPDVRIDG
jgi:hypothetical protein